MTTTTTNSTTTRPAGEVFTLRGAWPGVDPFLFSAHHVHVYPRGNGAMGPDASLASHTIGNDFGHPDGWDMYHGSTVPGFPAHPHRGFETITIVTRGLVDHADSTGAAARFGNGDVQWLTAGHGISHGEMFPLLDDDQPNPFELFQIWINLPARSKAVDPEFTIQWHEDIPVITETGPAGGEARVSVIAGTYGDVTALAPPVNSWAADADHDVAVWLVHLEPHARIELPAPVADAARRVLYVYDGGADLTIDDLAVSAGSGYAPYEPGVTVLETDEHGADLVLLQGVPIGEPVAQHGPFVMNTQAELAQAFDDYRRTQFGGWPWDRTDVVHDKDQVRFARHTDGRLEEPGDRS